MKYLVALIIWGVIPLVSAQSFEIKDWFEQPDDSVVTLSPNGESILWLTRDNSLLIQSMTSAESRQIELRQGDRFVDGEFIANRQLVFIVQRAEAYRVLLHDLATGKQSLLLESQFFPVTLANRQYFSPNGLWLLVKNELRFLNLEKRQVTQSLALPEATRSVFLSRNSTPCAAISEQGNIHLRTDDGWQQFKQFQTVSKFLPDADCRQFWVLASDNADTASLYTVDGQSTVVAFRHPKYDISDFLLAPNQQSVAAIFYDADYPEVKTFSQPLGQLKASLEKQYGKIYWNIISQSRDGHRLLVDIESPNIPPMILWVNTKTHRWVVLSRKLGRYREQLWAKTIPLVAETDGAKIIGYFTQADTLTAKTPMMIRLHGGPFLIRDAWRFDPEAQWLASQGVSTLTVNYRGSSGFGQRFQSLAFGNLRSVIESDIEAIRDQVAELFDYSPDNLCIYGSSFGGFAALSELVENNDDYQCGVLVSSVVSLPSVYESLTQEKDRATFKAQFGNPEQQSWRAENNLFNYLDDVTAPLLVVYGQHDERVSPEQSAMLIQSLQKLGHPVTPLVFNASGHQIEQVKDKIAMYQAVQSFLKRYLMSANETN